MSGRASAPVGGNMSTTLGQQPSAKTHDARYKNSMNYMDRARQVIPGGVMSAKRGALRPTPLTFASASGSHIVDVDGNDYVDYVAGYGPMLLGHAFGPVDRAVAAQLSRGTLFGGQHEGEARLAELLIEAVPSAERVLFNVSGSESDHAALRLARAATGRRTIVKFEGNYHGWLDPMAAGGTSSRSPEDTQQSPAPTPPEWHFRSDDVLICPWNDAAALRKLMDERGHEVAAVILEPVAVNSGAMTPDAGYLDEVRKICTHHDALLIFDEVITGFRLALGGAQELFGVRPDLTVMGKAIASGHQLSAVVGRADVMDIVGGKFSWAGTMNGQALAVAAAIATVSYLGENRRDVYDRLNETSATLVDGVNVAGREAGVPLVATRAGAVIRLYWDVPAPTNRFENVVRGDAAAMATFSGHLVDLGVHAREGGLWYVSAAHTPSDVDRTLAAVHEALRRTGAKTELQRQGQRR